MRDTSRDYMTAWLWGDMYYSHLEGLGQPPAISERGRQIIRRELERDPSLADEICKLVCAKDPARAIARQVQADLAEALEPTGKKIVFKSLVSELLPGVRRAQEAIVRAMPYQETLEGGISVEMLKTRQPERLLSEHFSAVALEQLAPNWENTGLGQFPFPLSVRRQQQLLELARAQQPPTPPPPQQVAAAAPAAVQQATSTAVSNVNVVVGESVTSAFRPEVVVPPPPPIPVPVAPPPPPVPIAPPVPPPVPVVVAPIAPPAPPPEEKELPGWLIPAAIAVVAATAGGGG